MVTGNNLFPRSMGSAVGVAVFGALANSVLGPDGAGDPDLLTTAVHRIFLTVTVLAVLMVLTACALPRTVADA